MIPEDEYLSDSPPRVRPLNPRFLGLSRGGVVWFFVSVAAYSLIFNWRIASAMLISLFIHEHGHLWAARRCGQRTGGITMIPFVGGVANILEAFPSRAAEVFVALMGPIWGFMTALVMAAGYWLTNNLFFAGAAVLICAVNLFNLLPVNPLDGGRVFKSVVFSINRTTGFVLVGASLLVGSLLLIYYRAPVVLVVVYLGVIDLRNEMQPTRRQRLNLKGIGLSLTAYVVVFIALTTLLIHIGHAFSSPDQAFTFITHR